VISGKLIPAGSGFGVVPGIEAEVLPDGEAGGSVAVLPGEADDVEPASVEDLEELMMQGLVPSAAGATDLGDDDSADVDVEDESLNIIEVEDLLDDE
jgi:hypothetical protein